MNFFFDMKQCFEQHQLVFCRHNITLCAMVQRVILWHKIAFRATPNFYFGHRLEC